MNNSCMHLEIMFSWQHVVIGPPCLTQVSFSFSRSRLWDARLEFCVEAVGQGTTNQPRNSIQISANNTPSFSPPDLTGSRRDGFYGLPVARKNVNVLATKSDRCSEALPRGPYPSGYAPIYQWRRKTSPFRARI